MIMVHPFDRYAAFTDLAALKAASSKPLRKCVRVNTLKCSVDTFKEWAMEKGWTLAPVAWSREGFFLDRENRESALGRDLRHLLGHFYMQEAASMLPASLLDPQPGEAILDMCAAPGSKTTQMADTVQGRGVIIANDMQEKRLRVLCDALQRMGAANVIVTRKVGQWFARHMTERFDRVLCDAPCTAQGTIRKDLTALSYSSEDSIVKASRLQYQLLEASIHATKVGGRIVYSTCTLTPEENEEVILEILNKFSDQLEVVHPREALPSGLDCDLSAAISASETVQKSLNLNLQPYPFLRLWPQTYDTEGFFCAVLRKVKPTLHPEHMDMVQRTASVLSRMKKKALQDEFSELYGTDFLQEGDELVERGQQVLLTSRDATDFRLPLAEYATGIPYARDVGNGRFRITNELVALRGQMASKQVMDLSHDQLSLMLSGKDISCSPALKGDTVLSHRGMQIGLGLAKEGLLLNRLPRWVVKLGGL